MSKHELTAKVRKLFGRKVRRLRAAGIIPGNVFGKKSKSQAIELDKKKLVKTIQEAGETGLIDLTIEGESKKRPVLVAGYAQDPVTGDLLHVDLHEVDLKQKTTAAIPIETVGESPAVEAGNVLVVLKNDVEVEALPTDFPDNIEVDVSVLLEVGDAILAKDLKLDREKVTLMVEDEEQIVTIQEPAKEPEPEVVEEAEGEGEEGAEGEAEAGEGEAKEGDKAEGGEAKEEGKEEKPAE